MAVGHWPRSAWYSVIWSGATFDSFWHPLFCSVSSLFGCGTNSHGRICDFFLCNLLLCSSTVCFLALTMLFFRSLFHFHTHPSGWHQPTFFSWNTTDILSWATTTTFISWIHQINKWVQNQLIYTIQHMGLTILTFIANCLNYPAKRASLWRTAKTHACPILCVQETHFQHDASPTCCHRDFSLIYTASGPKKYQGVLITVHRSVNFIIASLTLMDSTLFWYVSLITLLLP